MRQQRHRDMRVAARLEGGEQVVVQTGLAPISGAPPGAGERDGDA